MRKTREKLSEKDKKTAEKKAKRRRKMVVNVETIVTRRSWKIRVEENFRWKKKGRKKKEITFSFASSIIFVLLLPVVFLF